MTDDSEMFGSLWCPDCGYVDTVSDMYEWEDAVRKHDCDSTNHTAETLGDALGPGVTKDDLADTERVLHRFESVAMDEFDDNPDWLTTAHSAVEAALQNYNTELDR